MTEPLRRTHFRIWIVLSALLPIFYAAALIVRRPTTPKNSTVNWEKYK